MKSVGQLPEGGAVDLQLSRSISIALLVLYVLYVYFQLVTHKDGPPSAFKAPQEWESTKPKAKPNPNAQLAVEGKLQGGLGKLQARLTRNKGAAEEEEGGEEARGSHRPEEEGKAAVAPTA